MTVSDLDLVEFEVSADKSSTESENEGLSLPVTSGKSLETASTRAPVVLPAMTQIGYLMS